jgi:macrolide-specific efflux system membrane fusion protein
MNDGSTQSATPNRRRRSGMPLVLTLLVLVAAGAAYGWYRYQASKADEGEYIFATITTGDIEDLVSSTGTLQPRDYVDVGAQVSGQIEEIFVEVGDVVVVGQKLAKIDATTSQAKVDANRSTMESRKTSLESQKTNLEKAKRDYERQLNLFAEDATTKEALLNAETTYKNQERSVKSSELDIKTQEANMRIEEKNLQYTDIVAPIADTIMSIAVKKGQTVNASQNVPNVLRIANLSTMTVASDVSEADVSRLYDNNPVYFTTLGGGNRRWTSVLKRIEPTPKTTNGVVLYNALFDITNEGSLRPSMTAQVYYIAAEAHNVLKVPMAAIQQGQQISRELAAKARAEGKQPAAGAPGAPGAAGAALGTPGAGAATSAAGAREGGSAPATAAAGGTNPAAPAAQGTGTQNNRQANAQGGNAGGQRPNGQGGNFGGQRPGGGQGGNFGGQRPGGGQGGNFGGQRPGGGFNGGRNFTPEEIAEFQRMRGGGGGGNFGGGFNRQTAMASAGGAGAAPRQAQRRRGIVMVKKADGTLEQRSIMYGVSDRVFAEVLEGLKEGEQVVVGKREPEAAASRPLNQNNNQQFQQNQNFRGGNNFQGGGNFGGGGGRPF